MIPAYVGARLEGRPLHLASRCDICGRPRNKGKHDKCSQQRQKELLASTSCNPSPLYSLPRYGGKGSAMPKSKQAAPWCPDECPITGRKFFMWIERTDGRQVPTYGGPYDSFTIAERDEHGTFWCERFDHDEGAWSDSIHIDLRLIDNQREDFEFGHVEELQNERETLRRALGGMLFAFDDGVGQDWSQGLLDFARQVTPAVEFKP